MYEITVLTTVDEFSGMGSAWRELKEKAGDKLLYSSFEWIILFFERYSHKADPYIILVHEGDELIGAAPLMRMDGTYTRIKARRLEFASSSINGDLNDFIITKDHYDVVKAIFNFLLQQSEEWDYAFFMLFLKDFTIAKHYPDVFKELKINAKTKPGPYGYRMKLSGSWDDYYQTRSSNLKKMLNNRTRRFEKSGGMTVEHYQKPEEVETAIAEVREVHEKSWQGKDGCGVFSKRQKGFYETFAKTAAENGWLDIWVIKLDSKPIAFEYSIIYNGLAHCLKWEFDGEYSRYSPGLMLRRKSLQYYFENGIELCDLLSRYGTMKLKWTDVPTETYDLLFFNNSVKGKFLRGASNLRSGIKQLMSRFKNDEDDEYVAGI